MYVTSRLEQKTVAWMWEMRKRLVCGVFYRTDVKRRLWEREKRIESKL